LNVIGVGALVALASVSLCLRAAAQTDGRRSIELTAGVAGTYGNLVGGDFGGTRGAAGFEANGGVALGRWQLGIGYDRTTHAHDGTEGNFVVSNVYLEPRLMFEQAGREWTPYIAARGGRAMASYEGFLGLTDKATGYMAGVGAGLIWSVGRHVQFDAAMHYARLSHDSDMDDYSDAEKGGRTNVRLGIRVGLSR
jgi:hypothetical protein